MSSRLPMTADFAVREQRNENGRFLFSPVRNLLQQGLAYPFRSVCTNSESEGGYRFEVVNLYAAIIGYAYGTLYLVIPQNSALAEYLDPCPKCRGGYPEQFAEFPLGHGGCAYIARQGDIALLVYLDYIPFSFHLCSVLRLLSNGTANVFLHILQLVRQGFHVLTNLLSSDFGVYLRGLDVSVSQQTAHRFDGYSIG